MIGLDTVAPLSALCNYITELRALGHTVELTVLDAAEMRDLMIENCRNKHARTEKEKAATGLPA